MGPESVLLGCVESATTHQPCLVRRRGLDAPYKNYDNADGYGPAKPRGAGKLPFDAR
jgi:hypothetical protein